MADFGDALSTAIISQTDSRPSLFEVVAQNNLGKAIRPAMKHVIKVLAQNNPQHFNWYFNWYDELYTAVETIIQNHFLSNYSASFAEYYYDLKRHSTKSVCSSHTFPLGTNLHCCSLVALSLLPYLHVKIENQYNEVKNKCLLKGFKELTIIDKVLFHCYPILHLMWNFSFFYYLFLYAIGKSNFSTPIQKCLNLQLVYDITTTQAITRGNTSFSNLFTRLLTGGVYAGVFGVQFFEWWFDENNAVPLKQMMNHVIPKPPLENIQKTNIPIPASGICPLCNQFLKNDTVLLTSGYVFCYVCVFKYVKNKRQCPLTGYASSTSHLAKVYPPV